MIETETKTTITCDVCGRAIAEGETWYQSATSLASSTFEGMAGNLTPIRETVVQLCTDHVDGFVTANEELAPIAARADVPAPITR